MMSDELKKIVEKLKKCNNMCFLEGATVDQIIHFEEENEVKLPKKYKEWLQFSDGGECYLPAGVQFYGVGHKPTIDVNDNDRPNDNYILIGTLSMGDPILCEKDGDQICIYNHEAGKIEDDEIYTDFYTFLSGLDGILGIGG